jgi:hypothetical protein
MPEDFNLHQHRCESFKSRNVCLFATAYLQCVHRIKGTVKHNWFVSISYKDNDKAKAIPLHALSGPEGSSRLRLPDFKTIGT